MATFICFMNWTDQGAKGAKDYLKRSQAGTALAQRVGGKVLSSYVTTGQYDAVVTFEMPDANAMVKLAAALSSAGNVRTTTVQAFTSEEFAKLANEAPAP